MFTLHVFSAIVPGSAGSLVDRMTVAWSSDMLSIVRRSWCGVCWLPFPNISLETFLREPVTFINVGRCCPR